MRKVLILGNGISRLLFRQRIEFEFDGDVWACNYAYLEYASRISRLSGHIDVMKEAIAFREQHNFDYQIWTGVKHMFAEETNHFDCPSKFHKDTGTTFVAQALYEGWDEVHCCGFDLGGPDCISPDLQNQDKTSWVKRWRAIAKEYTLDRVQFWGFDHKPYILSNSNAGYYSSGYKSGRPHINDEQYANIFDLMVGVLERKSPLISEGAMVRVRMTRNGAVTEMTESVASIYERKGKVEILGPVEEEVVAESVGESPITEESLAKMKKSDMVDYLEDATGEERELLKNKSTSELREAIAELLF